MFNHSTGAIDFQLKQQSPNQVTSLRELQRAEHTVQQPVFSCQVIHGHSPRYPHAQEANPNQDFD